MKSNTTLFTFAGVAIAAVGAYLLLKKPSTLTEQLKQMRAGATAISFASTLEHAPNMASLDGAWAGVKSAYASGSFGQGVYDLLHQLYNSRGGVNP